MTALTLANIGSEIHGLIDDIPDAISGGRLSSIIDRKRLYMEKFLGVTIGNTAIADQYQPSLFNLSVADLLRYINVQGSDASTIKLGEFTTIKGKDSGGMASAEAFEKQGMDELKSLKKSGNFYKAWGV